MSLTSATGSTNTTRRRVPYKQIRARQPVTGQEERKTLVVYQAYSSAIAIPAAREQKLDASPAFRVGRMTWIKPSFLWCMYRSGWSYKDPNQERILAIEMSVDGFRELIRSSVSAMDRDRPTGPVPVLLSQAGTETETEAAAAAAAEMGTGTEMGTEREKEKEKVEVRFQWDPERNVKLGRLSYRSLQVGIAGGMVRRWMDEWIVRIEDVTEDVRRFHALIEHEGDQGAAKVIDELKGDKWREDVLELGEELEMVLGMPGDVAS